MQSLLPFGGTLYPVNPKSAEILGRTCYPDIAALPERVDLAVIVTPADGTPEIVQMCADAGIRAALICAGGFGEVGGDGARRQTQLGEIARDSGLRLLGPNTSGFVNPHHRLTASFVPAARAIAPGSIAIVAQSGGVHHALGFLAQNSGAGLSLGVGLGNAVDVGFDEVLSYVAEDAHTQVIALHIEGTNDGRRLHDAVANITPRKPVVALKVGRSNVDTFARSHTGVLTGNWALAREALTQAGAVVVEDTIELIDAARALASQRLQPRANAGVAVVTGQAGPGLLIHDLLGVHGVKIPELAEATRKKLMTILPGLTSVQNPVDTGRPDKTLGAVIETITEDQNVDAMLVYMLHEPDAVDPVAVFQAIRRGNRDVRMLFATGGPLEALASVYDRLGAQGIPAYDSPERGARAMRALVADARAAARLQVPQGTRTLPASTLPAGPLDEAAAKTLLERFGFRTPARRICVGRASAHDAFKDLVRATGRPVVAKVLNAAIAHKSEVGGVVVNITTEDELDRALDAFAALQQERYLLEEMASSGVELIVGGKRDASFGPTVLLGLGGIAAEGLADVALRLAPLSRPDALEMAEQLRGKAVLDGFRGLPKVDRHELAEILMSIGNLLVTYPEIQEIDVNPLRGTSAGLVALDALIVRAE